MAKDFFIVSLEGDAVRAVRMEPGGKALECAVWERRGVGTPSGETPLPPAPLPDGEAEAEAEGYGEFLERAFAGVVKKFKTREVILGVGLSDVLAAPLRLPPEDADILPDKALELLSAQSPFPDEPLEIDVEPVSETSASIRALAYALPESAAKDMTAALESAGLNVLRADLTALGWLLIAQDSQNPRESTESAHSVDSGADSVNLVKSAPSTELVLLHLGNGWEMLLLEGGAVSLARGIGEVPAAALRRELTLTLVRNAPFGVGRAVAYVAEPVADDAQAVLKDFGAEVVVVEDPFGGAIGLGRRAVAAKSEGFTPASWKSALKEARFKRRLRAVLAVAGAIWLVALGVLVGVPKYFDYLTDQVKAQSKAHRAAYKAVSDTRERALLVKRYSNRDTSALEMMRIVAEQMPYGVNLNRLQYVKDEKLVVAGDAEDAQKVYAFKDNLTKMSYVPANDDSMDDSGDGEAVPLFALVDMKGPTLRRGRQQFTLECSFKAKEDD